MINKKTSQIQKCKICGSLTNLLDDKQMKVTYSVCDKCGFIYKNVEHHLSLELEYKEYQNHNNSFASKGYVSMFENLISKYIKPLNISGKALDFGSGPGPVLKELLRRAGFTVFDYDPFFNSNKEYLQNKYNLITVTEVIEHFTEPLTEFNHLQALLDKNGYLVLMSLLNPPNIGEFLKSRYRRERTHISFYSLKTIQYIAKKFNLEIIKYNDKDIIVLKNF